MEREQGEIKPEPDDAVGSPGNDALPVWRKSVSLRPSLPDEQDQMADAVDRARLELEQGRGVPHELVSQWLASWGTPDEKPMPREWLE